jgi:RNA polymerase sigma factor (TIGR02999 family)
MSVLEYAFGVQEPTRRRLASYPARLLGTKRRRLGRNELAACCLTAEDVGSIGRGSRIATDALFSTLYGKLLHMAHRELVRHGRGLSVSATTLLHDTYIEITAGEQPLFTDRKSFMVYATRVMRGLLVDRARQQQAQKRGGQFQFVSITDVADTLPGQPVFAVVRDALDALATADAKLARLVDLKFFCGFSLVEIAAMRGVSERTVQRDWEKARLYLRLALDAATSAR